MENIKVPVSPGEVLDKITILEIKSERISDPEKVSNVRRELELLQKTWEETIRDTDEIQKLHAQLKEINEALWEIEDDIRDKERAREFDDRFIVGNDLIDRFSNNRISGGTHQQRSDPGRKKHRYNDQHNSDAHRS